MTDINIDIPSVSILLGKPASGKSHLIKYLIYKNCLNKKIDFVYVFCGTAFNNSYDFLPKKFVSNTYNENSLKKIIWNQKKLIEKKKIKNCMIVFDDVMNLNFKSKFWAKLISEYRHYNLTLLFGVQYILNALPPIFRTCCRYAMVYYTDDESSINAIKNNFMMDMNKHEVYNYIKNNTGSYHFIFIDKNKPKEERYKVCIAPAKIPKFYIEQ